MDNLARAFHIDRPDDFTGLVQSRDLKAAHLAAEDRSGADRGPDTPENPSIPHWFKHARSRPAAQEEFLPARRADALVRRIGSQPIQLGVSRGPAAGKFHIP